MKKFIFALLFITILTPFSSFADEPKRVVLVLGGGGSRGLAHVGVIEELENLGIVPDVIIGCSSGAVVGALYAQYKDIGKVKELLINMKYDDLIDFSVFQKRAFSTRKKLEFFLKKHLTTTHFSSLKIPFIAVATDLRKGEPVYFKEGEVLSALLASAALPGLFAPYEIGNRLYVDGGVSDPLPVQFAHTLGDVIVIASDISPSLDDFDTNNLPQVMRKSIEVLYRRLAYFSQEKADVLFNVDCGGVCSPIDDSANQQIYEAGKKAVRNNSQETLKRVATK